MGWAVGMSHLAPLQEPRVAVEHQVQCPGPAQGASVPEEFMVPLRRSEPAGYMTQHATACSSTVLSCTITTCMLQPQAACNLGRRAHTEPILCQYNTAAAGDLYMAAAMVWGVHWHCGRRHQTSADPPSKQWCRKSTFT